MKIKLKSNGQIINPPLRVAQRYVRLGRAVIVEPEPVPKPTIKVEKVKVSKPKKKSKKKEEIIESQAIEETPFTGGIQDSEYEL
jgi:hypothetical protein